MEIVTSGAASVLIDGLVADLDDRLDPVGVDHVDDRLQFAALLGDELPDLLPGLEGDEVRVPDVEAVAVHQRAGRLGEALDVIGAADDGVALSLHAAVERRGHRLSVGPAQHGLGQVQMLELGVDLLEALERDLVVEQRQPLVRLVRDRLAEAEALGEDGPTLGREGAQGIDRSSPGVDLLVGVADDDLLCLALALTTVISAGLESCASSTMTTS